MKSIRSRLTRARSRFRTQGSSRTQAPRPCSRATHRFWEKTKVFLLFCFFDLLGMQGHHIALAPFDQGKHVVVPARQRCLHSTLVGAAVVDAGDAAAVAPVMIERGLDHMRLDADISH